MGQRMKQEPEIGEITLCSRCNREMIYEGRSVQHWIEASEVVCNNCILDSRFED